MSRQQVVALVGAAALALAAIGAVTAIAVVEDNGLRRGPIGGFAAHPPGDVPPSGSPMHRWGEGLHPGRRPGRGLPRIPGMPSREPCFGNLLDCLRVHGVELPPPRGERSDLRGLHDALRACRWQLPGCRRPD